MTNSKVHLLWDICNQKDTRQAQQLYKIIHLLLIVDSKDITLAQIMYQYIEKAPILLCI